MISGAILIRWLLVAGCQQLGQARLQWAEIYAVGSLLQLREGEAFAIKLVAVGSCAQHDIQQAFRPLVLRGLCFDVIRGQM